MRIAYLSDRTISPLVLREYPSIVFEYNACEEQLLQPVALKAFNPSLIIISINQLDLLKNVTSLAKELGSCQFLIFSSYSFEYKPLQWLDTDREKFAFNYYLSLFNQLNIFILDMDRMTHFSSLFDNRMYYLADFPYSRQGIQVIQEHFRSFISAMGNKRKKCLVLDLDNVLWGNLVSEEGLCLSRDGAGKAYYNFQKAIKSLMESGIILCLNSKNDYETTVKVIETHPDMVLRLNDFAAIRINWLDKAQNIVSIAKELNIGLDSMVFLDDSDFERNCVRNLLPVVTVPDLPKDASDYCSFLAQFKGFECLRLSSEDRNRNNSYVQDRERRLLERDMTYEEYLAKLNIVIKVSLNGNNSPNIGRISQLTQRTNQFNFRSIRYLEKDIIELINSGAMVYTVEYKDIVGEQGIIGVGIVLDNVLDTFLLSCRVLQRGVESVFLEWLLKKHPSLKVSVIPTEKNKLAQEFVMEKGIGWISVLET
jgi:FkbH-like protein